MDTLNRLKERLDTLCIFRDFLADDVINRLCEYIENPSVSAYADFVGALYKANGGNISLYVKKLCSDSENVYVCTVGRGVEPEFYMKDALDNELSILQDIADLTFERLCGVLSYDGFLPRFVSEKTEIKANYYHRIENISKYGYGIYAQNGSFCLDANGNITPVKTPDTIQLSELVDYERERGIIIDNTKDLLNNKPAANILLTGDAGTGKSSSVKAVANAFFEQGLRIIEVRKDQLHSISHLLETLSDNPLKFILFIDDLSFLKDDDNFNALKAVLEGSVSAKSKNVVVYATSNRTHIVKERFSDREGDEIHVNDTLQEMMSLSNRFGIHITFEKPDKDTFLHIVHHMAEENGIQMQESQIDLFAERFALERGGRSARAAKQFIDSIL